MTKEEFQKEYIRMMDSMRDEVYKGVRGCSGVECVNDGEECPLKHLCNNSLFNSFDIVEAVEKWSKEHPIVTNLDKFKEVFGGVPKDEAGHLICPIVVTHRSGICDEGNCSFCKTEFWNSEYKSPVKEIENA